MNKFIFEKFVPNFAEQCKLAAKGGDNSEDYSRVYLVIDGEGSKIKAIDDPETQKISAAELKNMEKFF